MTDFKAVYRVLNVFDDGAPDAPAHPRTAAYFMTLPIPAATHVEGGADGLDRHGTMPVPNFAHVPCRGFARVTPSTGGAAPQCNLPARESST